MRKIPDPSKLLPLTDFLYQDWQQFLAGTHEAGHRYNSEEQTPAAKLKYTVDMYDQSGVLMVQTVEDHSSAVLCGKRLDACAKRLEKLFPKLLQADDEQLAPHVVEQLVADLHQRLLRRSEHWKAEAHLKHQTLLQQSNRDTAILATRVKHRREIIRKYLQDNSLTVPVLAERCGTTRGAIHAMILEDRSRFGPDSLRRVLKAIGISLEKWDGK